MLILVRRVGEELTIGDITVKVVRIDSLNRCVLGIKAPREIVITRPDMKKGAPAPLEGATV